MRRLLLVLMLSMLSWTSTGNGEIYELREVWSGTPEFKAIYYRARRYQPHETAIEFARALSDKRLWKELTAIAEVESGFDKEAVGVSEDIGAFQVVARWHGAVPGSVVGQCNQASRILEQCVQETGGKVYPAIQSYNGSIRNPKTRLYAQRVQKIVKEISYAL